MAKETGNCKYKLYIECFDQKNCKKCGWNPEVEKKRKAKLKKKIAKTKKWIVGK